MHVLSFDIATGGLSGARFNERLECESYTEVAWNAAPRTAEELRVAFCRAARTVCGSVPAGAVCLSSFMHSFLLTDSGGAPMSPLFTWLDPASAAGVDLVRNRMGAGFHQRTGCRYHPMFPVFKLAAMNVAANQRVVSPKAWLGCELTGRTIEDYGMASASGLWNIQSGGWDDEILSIANIPRNCLPPVTGRDEIVGFVSKAAAESCGIPEGTPVVNGSGDGFFATLGSGCEAPARIAITLGTSAVARQSITAPILDESAGTFCYQSLKGAYLLGCAGSNGGNALDWARHVLGSLKADAGGPNAGTEDAVPVFLPMLHGERSPDWNPNARASWHGISAATTLAGLKQSVMESVAFNLAHYIEILDACSGVTPSRIVLSGNGFLEPAIVGLMGQLVAALVKAETVMPSPPGLSTLRGAAMCAGRALGQDSAREMERILGEAGQVLASSSRGLLDRYARYRELRNASPVPPA